MNLVRTILAVMLLTVMSFAQHTGGGSGGAAGSGVTNIATTAPLGGGPITTTGTLTCTSCFTGAASAAGNTYASAAGQGLLIDPSVVDNGTGTLSFSAAATHISSAQGTLTVAGTPFLTHSVTLNGGAQGFVDDNRSITCTAAAANSSAFQINVGGNPIFNMQFNAANCATPMLDIAAAAAVQIRLKTGSGVLVGNAVGFGWNSAASFASGTVDTGMDRLAGGGTVRFDANAGLSDGLGKVQAAAYLTTANCASSAGTCAAASSGSVSIAAAATTVTVATTAVTANSNIFVFEDSSLGTKLTVTCNTTTGRVYSVTARTAATSFVITASAAPATNPACLNYLIIN